MRALVFSFRNNAVVHRSTFIVNPFLKGVQEFRSDASLRSVDVCLTSNLSSLIVQRSSFIAHRSTFIIHRSTFKKNYHPSSANESFFISLHLIDG